jgi:hypothetical protein
MKIALGERNLESIFALNKGILFFLLTKSPGEVTIRPVLNRHAPPFGAWHHESVGRPPTKQEASKEAGT